MVAMKQRLADLIRERTEQQDVAFLTWLVHRSVWSLVDLYPDVNRAQMQEIVMRQVLDIVEVKKK